MSKRATSADTLLKVVALIVDVSAQTQCTLQSGAPHGARNDAVASDFAVPDLGFVHFCSLDAHNFAEGRAFAVLYSSWHREILATVYRPRFSSDASTG